MRSRVAHQRAWHSSLTLFFDLNISCVGEKLETSSSLFVGTTIHHVSWFAYVACSWEADEQESALVAANSARVPACSTLDDESNGPNIFSCQKGSGVFGWLGDLLCHSPWNDYCALSLCRWQKRRLSGPIYKRVHPFSLVFPPNIVAAAAAARHHHHRDADEQRWGNLRRLFTDWRTIGATKNGTNASLGFDCFRPDESLSAFWAPSSPIAGSLPFH